MLNKILFSLKRNISNQFTYLVILVAVFVTFQCSKDGPTNNDDSHYTPPELTNTTWETIATPESVGL